MKVRYFTMIELLAVVAIIAILAAMLLPALHGAARRAQSISCASSLRMLSQAFSMYAQDNRQRLPPYMESSVYGHGGTNWARYTFPYYGDTRVLDCPSSPQGAPGQTIEGLHLYDGNYGWNYDGTQGNRGPVQAIAPMASRAYLVFDSGDQCLIYGANNWTNLMEELDLDWDSRAEGPNRHLNKVNIAFLDGHVDKRGLLDFIAAPSKSKSPPWYIEWSTPILEPAAIPYPLRE